MAQQSMLPLNACVLRILGVRHRNLYNSPCPLNNDAIQETIDVQLRGDSQALDPRLVRSWCSCDLCGDSRTGLRWTSLTEIPSDLAAVSARQVGSRLSIEWSDGHRSEIDVGAFDAPPSYAVKGPSASTMEYPSMGFDDIATSDRALLTALDHLADSGVVHVTGAPKDHDAAIMFAELFGPIRVSNYGKLHVFITMPDPPLAAHTNAPQHPHTDEPFRYYPPGFLFFHSMHSAPEGEGSSILVDGFAVAEQLRVTNPEAFDILTKSPVEFHRQHDGDVRFSTRSRIISTDAAGEVQGIRHNLRCLAPLHPWRDGTVALLNAITAFEALVEEPENQHAIHLHSGEILVFDNHRILHGRTAFSDEHPRQLHSCNVDRDAVHSRHRVLAAKYQKPVPPLAIGPSI